jgi:glycosyltransferase involved in cell wall biosynthesis
MKTLMIIVPNLQLGGQQRVAIQTAELLESQYNIIFCVFTLEQKVFDYNGHLINLELASSESKLKKVLNLVRRVKSVKKIVKEYNVDIVLGYGMTANLVVASLGSITKKIVSIRGFNSLPNNQVERVLSKYIYGKADLIISVSKELSKAIVNQCKVKHKKVKTLYNPYDIAKIKQKANLSIEKKMNSVISVGRLDEIKGYHHLLQAIKIASTELPTISLTLVGDGPIKDKLQQYAKELHIEEKVQLVGFQENPYQFMCKSTVYALTSITEGFPNALVEAMVCGLPVVAVDCSSGPREILSRDYQEHKAVSMEECEYGILVPPFESDISDEYKKEEELANTLVDILTSEEKYNHYRKQGQIRIQDYSNEKYVENIITIFNCLLSK